MTKCDLKVECTYLDVVDRKNANHGIVFTFVPVLVDLSSHEDDVTLLERELSATIKFPLMIAQSKKKNPRHLEFWAIKLYKPRATILGSGVRSRWLDE